MDEFAEIFFTGSNAEGYAKFCRIVRILSLVGAIFTLVGAAFALFENTSIFLQLPFCLIGVLFGVAANIILLFKRRVFNAFFELQRAQNGLGKGGEARDRDERLAEAYLKTHRVSRAALLVPVILRCASYATLCVAAVLIGGGFLSEGWLMAAVGACLVLSIVPAVWVATREMKERAALYAAVGKDIDAVKRERHGWSEKRIASAAESAKSISSLPAPVELFLKEDVEREDFRKVAKRSGLASLCVGFFLGVALLLPAFLAGVWDKMGPTLSWTLVGCVLFVAFLGMLVMVFPLETRKKEIFKRNYEKLGDGEADGLRKNLQNAWIVSQRRGNIMFLAVFVAAVVLGIVLGLIGYFTVDGMVLADSIGSSVIICLIPAAIGSLVVWAILYGVYRRKVRPEELKLKRLREEEE